MRPETKTKLANESDKIARVRGTLQGMAVDGMANASYLRNRAAELEAYLAEIQNALIEIEWSEETDWLNK